MGYVVFKINKEYELAAGQSRHISWNNAAPEAAVWAANAVPVLTGSTAAGFDQVTTLEVTRLWRKFIVVDKSTNQFADVNIETEIHCEVKNIGAGTAKFHLYFSAMW